MAETGRTVLKTYFETEDEPTEEQFADSIDSPVNIKDDIENGTDKVTPIDADKFLLWDSVASALKTLTWANLKAAVGGGAGGEFQVYDLRFYTDTNTSNWFGIFQTSLAPEYNRDCSVAKTASMVTVADSALNVLRPAGIAIGNQTVVRFDLWFSGKAFTNITHLSIIKARLSSSGAITAIAVLYEQAVIFDSDGYLSLEAVDFTETAISDKDIIYISLGTNTVNDIAPCFYRLKCSID